MADNAATRDTSKGTSPSDGGTGDAVQVQQDMDELKKQNEELNDKLSKAEKRITDAQAEVNRHGQEKGDLKKRAEAAEEERKALEEKNELLSSIIKKEQEIRQKQKEMLESPGSPQPQGATQQAQSQETVDGLQDRLMSNPKGRELTEKLWDELKSQAQGDSPAAEAARKQLEAYKKDPAARLEFFKTVESGLGVESVDLSTPWDTNKESASAPSQRKSNTEQLMELLEKVKGKAAATPSGPQSGSPGYGGVGVQEPERPVATRIRSAD
jgi:chromosome segregation ATPase